jgi:phage terminase small subunit
VRKKDEIKMNENSGLPRHLKAAGRHFYGGIITEYRIMDGVGLALVLRASECVDRLTEARAAIAKHGAVIEQNNRLTANPAVKIEREAMTAFLSAMRLLNLDTERRKSLGRPPRPIGVTLESLTSYGNGNRDWTPHLPWDGADDD